jgi:hypothetical protein
MLQITLLILNFFRFDERLSHIQDIFAIVNVWMTREQRNSYYSQNRNNNDAIKCKFVILK